MATHKDKIIWIAGASSGIGRALAVSLAKQGATLVLSARNEEDLRALNHELGDQHMVAPLDVTDVSGLESIASKIIDSYGRIDRAIFMAAIYNPGELGEVDLPLIHKMLDVNLKGGFNFVQTVLPFMRAAGGGQIALCGSVAGYRGLPKGQPYCATKAGVINLAESLCIEEAPNNIDIKVINPGFVKTRLTDKNKFKMPMIIQADEAGEIIARDLLTNRFEIHFPRGFTYMVKLLAILPYWLFFMLSKNF